MKNSKGFTLIELLVVITILVVLSIIGIAAFRNVAGNARDAKRKSDIDAIAKVLEDKFDAASGQYPTTLEDNDFTAGSIPKTPEGSLYPSPIFNTDNTGFRVCATLDDGTNYCKQSSQGKFTVPVSPTASCDNVPQLFSGIVCKTNYSSNDNFAYVDCPGVGTSEENLLRNCDRTCNVSLPMSYYNTPKGGTGTQGSTLPLGCNGPRTVTLYLHTP